MLKMDRYKKYLAALVVALVISLALLLTPMPPFLVGWLGCTTFNFVVDVYA